MKQFAVTFDCGNGIYSTNIIYANTGREELEAVTETAQRKAEKHGYSISSIREITEWEAGAYITRGMPMYSIDLKAELDHDPSFSEEPEFSLDNGTHRYSASELDEVADKIDAYWPAIVDAMEDETREMLNDLMAPCSNIDFLAAYLNTAKKSIILG